MLISFFNTMFLFVGIVFLRSKVYHKKLSLTQDSNDPILIFGDYGIPVVQFLATFF